MLTQLPTPKWPWNSISMDVIEQLPTSSSFTAILVIVDCLSKQALFIPMHDTITLPKLAQPFLLHIFSKHSVPAHVMSNCGMECQELNNSRATPKHNLLSVWVHKYAVDLESLHEFLHIKMATMQKCYKGPADAKQSHLPDFKIGAKYLLKLHISTQHYHSKSSQRRISAHTPSSHKPAHFYSWFASPTLCAWYTW